MVALKTIVEQGERQGAVEVELYERDDTFAAQYYNRERDDVGCVVAHNLVPGKYRWVH
jgi:hypothetical protein